MVRETIRGWIVCGFVMSAGLGVASAADPENAPELPVLDQINKSIEDVGRLSLHLRLGFEYSSLENTTAPAKGVTLRTRLGFLTREFSGVQGFIQLQNVENLIEDFRSPNGDGDPDYDVIADPEGSRIHQAYIDLTALPETVIRVGRQEIILDDARLIGNIGWRMHGQSFTGVRVRNSSIPGLSLDASWINQVYNILNNQDPDLDHLILLQAAYDVAEGTTATLFTYMLDTEADIRDNITYGLRLKGSLDRFSYDLLGALQDDHADGDNHDGAMLTARVDAKLSPVVLGIGYEYISGGSQPGEAFDTLFSTAHKFNGWADQFLATNGGGLGNGLQDYYGKLVWNWREVSVKLFYHAFHTTEDNGNGFDGWYGHEFDLDVSRPLLPGLRGAITCAFYRELDSNAANPTADEDVVWVRLEYNY